MLEVAAYYIPEQKLKKLVLSLVVSKSTVLRI
jgi:hypothetical protein